MAEMPEQLARNTVLNYRCSRCWGFLFMRWVLGPDGEIERTENGEALAEVFCNKSQQDLGFVSKHFVDLEKSKDFEYAFEVRRDLENMGILKGV